MAPAGVNPDAGIAIVRLVGAAAAAGALAFAWHDLAGLGRRAPAMVAGGAVALTPLVGYTVGLGQTSSLLLLSAAAGAPAITRRGWVGAAAWAGVVALKVFPAAAAVAVRRRSFGAVLVVIGALGLSTVLGVVIAGSDRLGEFVDAAGSVTDDARSGQPSAGFESVARLVVDRDPFVTLLAWSMRVPLLVLLVRAGRRSETQARGPSASSVR